MYKLVVAATLAVVSLASKPRWAGEFSWLELNEYDLGKIENFNQWASVFNKEYKNVEIASKHYLQWLENARDIAKHNSGDFSDKWALNQFSDLSSQEFRLYVHGKDGRCFKPDEIDISLPYSSSSSSSDDDSFDKPRKLLSKKSKKGLKADPTSVDWRTKGVVTPVKNQGQCGSCWSFSTTGALECDYAIKTGTLNSLSEQQLVDCAGLAYGCAGCNGGQMTGAMRYVSNEGGLCTEKEYPYTARNGNCKASSCGTKYDKNSGYNSVKADSSQSLEDATASGCVSIAIEADQTAFQHYSSGVLTGTCGTNLDHGVLVVGYGTQSGTEYWLVKNSWGTSWGEQGYIKICRNCNKNGGRGECGILMEPIVPTF